MRNLLGMSIALAVACVLVSVGTETVSAAKIKECPAQTLQDLYGTLDAACPCDQAVSRRFYRKCVRAAARKVMKEARRSLPIVCRNNVVRCMLVASCGMPGFVTCRHGQAVACVFTGVCADNAGRSCVRDADCTVPPAPSSCDFPAPTGHCSETESLGCSSDLECPDDDTCILTPAESGTCRNDETKTCTRDVDCTRPGTTSPCDTTGVTTGACKGSPGKVCASDADCAIPVCDVQRNEPTCDALQGTSDFGNCCGF
jgi:hypothetical protein